ncbi:hypothetical protein F4780DRAFT_469528 [Xylariomycetidae sp. FL0641]|nr:hypothetical protein F4780DRAFT_469528 [Xylariomycetidae sp. FL0641]
MNIFLLPLLLLLPLLPLTVGQAPLPPDAAAYRYLQTPYRPDCVDFQRAAAGSSCWALARANGLSVPEFLDRNPALRGDCARVWAGHYYCVRLAVDPLPATACASPTSNNATTQVSAPPWPLANTTDAAYSSTTTVTVGRGATPTTLATVTVPGGAGCSGATSMSSTPSLRTLANNATDTSYSSTTTVTVGPSSTPTTLATVTVPGAAGSSLATSASSTLPVSTSPTNAVMVEPVPTSSISTSISTLKVEPLRRSTRADDGDARTLDPVHGNMPP